MTNQKLTPPTTGQVTVWDTNLKGFGVRLSQGGSKSFVVMKGCELKLITLGKYPSQTLKNARSEAKRLLAYSDTIHDSESYPEAVGRFLEGKERNLASRTHEAYTYYLRKFAFTGPVSSLTRRTITEALAEYDNSPASQNRAFLVRRTFPNWCLEEDLIERSPPAQQSTYARQSTHPPRTYL